jgi:hypothetical protein
MKMIMRYSIPLSKSWAEPGRNNPDLLREYAFLQWGYKSQSWNSNWSDCWSFFYESLSTDWSDGRMWSAFWSLSVCWLNGIDRQTFQNEP